MLRKLVLAALFVALGSVAAMALDFNGKWTATVETPMGAQNLTFNFKVDGTKLTGKVTSPRGETELMNGKVDGDAISFDYSVSFNGNDFKIVYTGKADGETIKFTRQVGDFPPVEFVASRAPAEPKP